ncbi:DUF7009 family protein [Ekhidna sp. To15]|uniref:DUF7009 family protein n=1 Tax=Ekhidna sp. To15 TaxID=3395267 RepID=UPI003F52562D
MKLRIRGNSIRIRLMQREVKQLAEEGLVTEEVNFPGGSKFIYSLKVASEFSASLSENHMQLFIPQQETMAWIASDEDLSLVESITLENGTSLKLMVEKDLACLTVRDGEDDSDAFPNPKKEC